MTLFKLHLSIFSYPRKKVKFLPTRSQNPIKIFVLYITPPRGIQELHHKLFIF